MDTRRQQQHHAPMSNFGSSPATEASVPCTVPRRAALQTIIGAGVGLTLAPWQAIAVGAGFDRLVSYLETHARPDGGYGWAGQSRSHLTPSFAVAGAYHVLGRQPPRKADLARFIRTHHPSELKKLEQEHREFDYQQIQSLVWLGEDVSDFHQRVSTWTRPTVYLKQYEQQSFPILRHEMTAFTCRALLGMEVRGLEAYLAYLDARRRSNGSFNNTPADDRSDGHVMNTLWGLQGLQLARGEIAARESTVAWVEGCRLPNGGFTWQPNAPFAGNDDVTYTWAAVCCLELLGAKPARLSKCRDYIASLRGSDGGFADRPGWNSNPMATYYALDTLRRLGPLGVLDGKAAKPRVRRPRVPRGLKIYTIQIQAHGKGSPAEAVDLAGALRIHLWGAKNATPEWLGRAQNIATRANVPVTFFTANEEYGTWVHVPGMGTYSHTSDIMAPAAASIGGSLAGQGVVSWPEFRSRRLDPLHKGKGRLVWQFGENEELVRLFLDDSLERGGYSAISTFHFGNPDFANSEPFLHRYRGRIPFVALQDAHGDEAWWFADMTTGFRTLFLAEAPTWEGWLKALENDWVAAVRRDAVSQNETWIHAGDDEVAKLVLERSREWRWWENPAISRPLVSIVALRPEDTLEAGHLESGLCLRVRCAWSNNPQGRLREPLAELVELRVDAEKVEPELIARKASSGPLLLDHYYVFQVKNPRPGDHNATAVVKNVATGAISRRTIRFRV